MPSNRLYGIRPVLEALRAGRRGVHRIWLAEGRRADRQTEALVAAATAGGVEVLRVGRSELDRIAGSASHQGIAAEAAPLPVVDLGSLTAEPAPAEALLVVLDGVQDPQNLGAIVRTTAAAGGAAVIVPRDRAAALTPAAVKVAEGAAEHVPVITVTNLARALRELAGAGFWLFGLAPEGERELWQADLAGPIALVLGSEGKGLRRLVREACDHAVRIPLAGPIASLNVASAAAIALFEAARQRRSGGPTAAS